MNHDLENFSQWLKANKLSLTVGKTKLIIFRPCYKKIDDRVRFKPDGKRLIPTDSVKYLGVLLDEHLTWTKQIYQVKTRLNWATVMLSMVHYHANLNIRRITHHSRFESHLLYGCQLWRQTNTGNSSTIQTLWKMWKISFEKRLHLTNQLHKDLKIFNSLILSIYEFACLWYN